MPPRKMCALARDGHVHFNFNVCLVVRMLFMHVCVCLCVYARCQGLFFGVSGALLAIHLQMGSRCARDRVPFVIRFRERATESKLCVCFGCAMGECDRVSRVHARHALTHTQTPTIDRRRRGARVRCEIARKLSVAVRVARRLLRSNHELTLWHILYTTTHAEQ